jgi:tetrahydromethanopterin S-methyltransferase subunit G
MNKRIVFVLATWLTLGLTAGAAEPAAPSPTALDREIGDLTDQVRRNADQLADLLERVDRLEQRMGESFQSPSPFNTVERRLDDLEKDVDRLKR